MDHPTDHIMTSNYTTDMLSCYTGFRNQELEPWTSSVVQWSKDDDICMYMLSNCSMSIIRGHGTCLIGVDHLIDHIMTPNCTLDMLTVTLVF